MNTQENQPQENPNRTQSFLQYLTPNNLSFASLVLGIFTFILVFFPDAKTLTIIFGIIALLLGLYSYYSTNGSLIAVIGILTSTVPLLFFLFLKLILIYIEAEFPGLFGNF